MSTIGEQITEAMAAALNAAAAAATPPLLPTVRQRPRPLTAQYADGTGGIDAMLLYATKEESKRHSANRVLRERYLTLEIPVAGDSLAGPLDQLADPVYLFAVQTLFVDPTFGGLCRWLEEAGVQWEVESSYLDAAVTAVELKVVFETTTDPSVSAT